MNMIAMDNQPFTLTENQGFTELIAHLQPKYLIPCRKYFTETMLPLSYKKLQGAVLNELSMAQYLSFTTDIWSNQHSQESFISLTAHWITNELEKRDCVLHCKHFPGSHTGINIATAFQSMLTEWQIEPERVHIIVRDDAYNMQLGIDLTGSVSISCFIHQLQLVIKEALFSQRSVSDLISKSKSISTHFNHSTLGCTELRRLQKEIDPKLSKTLLPIQDVPTRWSSTYLMLQRMETLKRCLQLYTAEHANIPSLTANEWQLLEKTLRLLQPFFMVTENISKSKSMMSSVIAHVRVLHRFLSSEQEEDSGVKTMKGELKRAMEKRFINKERKGLNNVYDSRQYVIRTTIDPRYKFSMFSDTELKDKAFKWLLSEVKEIVLNMQSKSEDASDSDNDKSSTSSSTSLSPSRNLAGPSSSTTALKSDIASDFLSCYLIECESDESADSWRKKKKRKLSAEDKEKATEESLRKEINTYFAGKTLSILSKGKDDDVLSLWKENKQQFPHTSIFAKKYLSTPASSVYSERFFSEAGNYFEEKRASLLPNTGEQLLFLHHNIPKFPGVLN